MQLVEQYKQRAEVCRILALDAAMMEHRKAIMQMANAWENLAKQREAYLRKHLK